MMGRKPIPFESRVKKCSHGEDCQICCWKWQGGKTGTGYGVCIRVIDDKLYQSAHRIAWVLKMGAIPENTIISHHCPNASCCNPAHLYEGYAREEGRDNHWRQIYHGLCARLNQHLDAVKECVKSFEGRERELEKLGMAIQSIRMEMEQVPDIEKFTVLDNIYEQEGNIA